MNRTALLLCTLLALPAALAAQTRVYDADTTAATKARLQSYRETVTGALKAYDARDYSGSVELFEKAFTLYSKPAPTELYNAACSASLAGMVDRGYAFLERSIAAGWEDEAHMAADADLAAMRADASRWSKLHGAVEASMKRRYGADFDIAMHHELMRIGAEDQAPRMKLVALQKEHGGVIPDSLMKPLLGEMARVDSVNIGLVTTILDTKGWPKRAVVGNAGQTVFLVIQHAALETQQKYMPMVEQAVKDGELHPSSFALLVDRVRVRTGQPQLYGSQLHQDEKSGATVFFPIEDEANVDARRTTMGLEPLADYARRFGLDYKGMSAK
jgi:hypothetical protein